VKSLIVEDELLSRSLLAEILRPFGAAQIAVDGRGAVEAVRTAIETHRPFELICLDIQLPEMDGIAALKEIRLEENRAGTDPPVRAKVLMTTSASAKETVVRAIEAGCDGYMLKPYEPDRVVQQLRDFGLIA
jgi:two-component system, chemotaxis family, chemotaxis protein CheY